MITQTETTDPTFAEKIGMVIIIIVFALYLAAAMMTRPATDPACGEVAPIAEEVR